MSITEYSRRNDLETATVTIVLENLQKTVSQYSRGRRRVEERMGVYLNYYDSFHGV
jgi:hypothetical protein